MSIGEREWISAQIDHEEGIPSTKSGAGDHMEICTKTREDALNDEVSAKRREKLIGPNAKLERAEEEGRIPF